MNVLFLYYISNNLIPFHSFMFLTVFFSICIVFRTQKPACIYLNLYNLDKNLKSNQGKNLEEQIYKNHVQTILNSIKCELCLLCVKSIYHFICIEFFFSRRCQQEFVQYNG